MSNLKCYWNRRCVIISASTGTACVIMGRQNKQSSMGKKNSFPLFKEN